LGAVVCLASAALAAGGPYKVATGYYQFLNLSEPLVATDRNIDLWAEVYRPQGLGNRPFPLIIFLHGNHGTCGHYDTTLEVRIDDRSDYTTTGACPSGYVVTPNHLGYAYMAEELASYGYIIVSINANRGITAGAGLPDDRGLNLMRGRLILRHLALLSGWNKGGGSIAPPATLGFNPVGAMDFNEVGLMGHSRGGEGARAALQQLRDAGSPFPALIGKIDIRSIFEIGPVDGQTSRVLDANGVNSIILLPACDGDVFNLQGMKVFDRVFLNTSPDPVQDFHGTTYVFGADHDAYNTEWQTADSPGCVGTNPLFPQDGESVPQQITARDQLIPFFRATVGKRAELSLAGIFDPLNPAAPTVTDITNVDRGYLPAPLGPRVQLLETFSQPTGTSDAGVPTTAVGVNVVQQAASFEHQVGTRVATVSWDATSPPVRYFQVNFATGQNMSDAESMSFRTALRCYDTICNFPASADGEMSYSVSLLDASGQVSKPISTSGLVRISRPVGSTATNLHSTLYTVQIPFAAVHGVNLHQVEGVRFVFQDEASRHRRPHRSQRPAAGSAHDRATRQASRQGHSDAEHITDLGGQRLRRRPARTETRSRSWHKPPLPRPRFRARRARRRRPRCRRLRWWISF